jgi:hypothetical protein
MRAVLIALTVLVVSRAAGAQTDPLRCWWRTTEGAVAMGEPFDATLTCAVREQEAVRTVPDESRLAASVVQLAPFEVIGGSHPADLRTPTHRFFQYHYNLRIIDRDVLGHDARFPDLPISYRVHSLANGEWVEGRERRYVIPGQPVRVESLVPAEATDIRDSVEVGFARIEALRFRARALGIAAVAFILIGLMVAAPSAAAVVRRWQRREPSTGGEVSRRGVLEAVNAELAAIGSESRAGWTPELAARATAALRVAAACSLGRPVAQHAAAPGAVAAGSVLATRGLFRKHSVSLSSALTASHLEQANAALPLTASADTRRVLDDLGAALRVFTGAVYGESFDRRQPDLDTAFAAAASAARAIGRRP